MAAAPAVLKERDAGEASRWAGALKTIGTGSRLVRWWNCRYTVPGVRWSEIKSNFEFWNCRYTLPEALWTKIMTNFRFWSHH